MIGKLTGRIDYIDSDHLILDVNSIGYTIYSPARFLSQSSIDDKISLFIYSQTREDGVYLYGFENIILKKQFLLLVTVKGVGPKLALSIISEMTIDEIGNAILMQDKNGFKRVSGLGPKIAERIIVELKNKTKELSLGDGVVTSIISDNTLKKYEEADGKTAREIFVLLQKCVENYKAGDISIIDTEKGKVSIVPESVTMTNVDNDCRYEIQLENGHHAILGESYILSLCNGNSCSLLFLKSEIETIEKKYTQNPVVDSGKPIEELTLPQEFSSVMESCKQELCEKEGTLTLEEQVRLLQRHVDAYDRLLTLVDPSKLSNPTQEYAILLGDHEKEIDLKRIEELKQKIQELEVSKEGLNSLDQPLGPLGQDGSQDGSQDSDTL